MKERLPVYIENLDLPYIENKKDNKRNKSYGYVSFLYLLSIIITIGSVITVFILGNR